MRIILSLFMLAYTIVVILIVSGKVDDWRGKTKPKKCMTYETDGKSYKLCEM